MPPELNPRMVSSVVRTAISALSGNTRAARPVPQEHLDFVRDDTQQLAGSLVRLIAES